MKELSILAELAKLKKEKNAVILAHYYTWPEVQELADFTGDSLGLSRKAAETDADIILFAGVEFMAETASIISPKKTVLIPQGNMGCSLADCITAEQLIAWKQQFPGAVVISYVNSTAAVKAQSDYCCTSGNAVNVLKAIPKDKTILFCPDANLGKWAAQQANRTVELWNGGCHVHIAMNLKTILNTANKYPDYEILMHPEASCSSELTQELLKKTHIYSTSGMLTHVANHEQTKYIVATEPGIIHELQKQNPSKHFVPVDDFMVCDSMKRITPANLLRALKTGSREIKVAANLAALARKPIERMININS